MVLLVNSTKYLGKKWCQFHTSSSKNYSKRRLSFSFYEANAFVCVYMCMRVCVCVCVCVYLSGAVLGITDKIEARP